MAKVKPNYFHQQSFTKCHYECNCTDTHSHLKLGFVPLTCNVHIPFFFKLLSFS